MKTLIIFFALFAGASYADCLPPDLNDDGKVDTLDYLQFRSVFGTDNEDADFNFDGVVDEEDLDILREYMGAVKD